MISDPLKLTIPLKKDEHGAFRIGNTRITLDTIIARYQQGHTPEIIHNGFPTIPLNDIYAVIAYYLSHRQQLDEYLRQQEADAEQLRQEIESRLTPEQQDFNEKVRKLAQEKRQEIDSE